MKMVIRRKIRDSMLVDSYCAIAYKAIYVQSIALASEYP